MFKSYDETKRATLTKLYKYMERVAASHKPTAKDKAQKHAWRQELRRTGLLSLPFSLNPKRWRK